MDGEKNMINYLVPIIAGYIIIYGLYKKIDIFDTFIEGVKEGINTSYHLFPIIFSMVIAINILTNSNILLDISSTLKPILKILSFPSEILPLAIIKPISGSSSIVILNDILSKYGPDTYIGRIASVIGGSTDTTIYIISLYFGSINIKKTKYALPVGLLADLICIIISVIVINILF